MATILDSLVGSCAKKLQDIITEEAFLILGVKEELGELQRTMSQIQYFLNDAEQRRTEEQAVNNWFGELRDAMYDADDIIDLATFEGRKLLENDPSSPRNSTACSGISLLSCFPNIKRRHEIAVQIRKLNTRIEKISKLGGSFLTRSDAAPVGQSSTSKLRNSSHLVEPNLVGKEIMHSSRKLVKVLTRSDVESWPKFKDGAPICALGGAMFKLPGKLDGLLRHGYMLPKGAGDEIPLIKRDLEEIIAILQDHISRSDHPSVMVNCWMKEVRELSYDIEDCIDQYEHAADSKSRSICKVTRRKFTSSKTNRLSEKLKQRLWMANKIREFSARVQEALQRHQMYILGGIGRTPPPPPPIYDASFRSPRHIVYGEAADLVGIDAPMNKLEEWLIKDGEQKLKVVSIVGFGGIGKTTLANELYCKLGGQFQCRAFVRASQKPDMRRLLISMLSQVRPHHPPDTWKVHNLIANIRTHLQDKRYLIVVDDVWATSTWDIVNCALPDDNRSSRILLTTEIEDVAHKCCGYDSKYVFMMKPLGDDDSKKLFFNTVFGPKHECPPELAEVANSIIRKCGGLPLATVTIASLLASQMGKQEQWDYLHKSLCYGLRTNATLEGTKQVLNLSYTNLPHHLKACMVYLSIYEEDYIVWKDDLVKQWIAEGFIYATEEQDNEEIAGSYFDELVSRRLIQPVHINDNDEVLSCVVHHMVLNLIAYKSIEENFVIAIDHSQTTTRLADKVRRLSLHFGNAEDATPPISMRLSQVRTLAFFGVFKCVPSIVEFRLLQVLILQVWGDEESISFDLARISQLFRLRYLQVTCNVTLELRTQMRGLQCLEVLKIDARASAVPSDIVHLPGLMHLNLPAETNLPNGIGHMTSLRTLGYFDLSGNSTKNVQSLGELSNLRDLQLTCYNVQPNNLKNNIQCLGSILGKLNNLRSITLATASSSNLNTLDVAGSTSMSISGDGLSSVSAPPPLLQRLELLPRACIFSSLPKWIGHLGKLCILKIGVRELARSDVDVLRGLPALTVLSLYVRTKPAERIVFDKAGFTVLKYFNFRCSVPWLKFEADAMPNLRKLKLGFNSLGADQHGSAHIIIEHLLCLKEITAKIEGAKADAESTLTTTISNHPSNPRINVQLVDCISFCNEIRSMGTKENEHRTLEEQDEILEEDTYECYKTQVEDSEEDANKQGEPLALEYKLYKGGKPGHAVNALRTMRIIALTCVATVRMQGLVRKRKRLRGTQWTSDEQVEILELPLLGTQWTSDEQVEILEEDTYTTQVEDSGEDANKQADCRVGGEQRDKLHLTTSAREVPDASTRNSMSCRPGPTTPPAQKQKQKAEAGLRRGLWTVEEDLMLGDYITRHGVGRWNSVPHAAGLKRSGKSCRLRWVSYLRPDLKRGRQLHRTGAAPHPRTPLPVGEQVVQDSGTLGEDRQRDQQVPEDQGAKAREAAQVRRE